MACKCVVPWSPKSINGPITSLLFFIRLDICCIDRELVPVNIDSVTYNLHMKL
jgi:hypothetical protein